MASAELSRRVEKVVGYPPLSELDELQRREFHETLFEAGVALSVEDIAAGLDAAQLGLPRERLHQLLGRMVKTGAIARVGRGRYGSVRCTSEDA